MAAPNPQAANLIWVLIAFILACVGVYYAVPKNHPDRVYELLCVAVVYRCDVVLIISIIRSTIITTHSAYTAPRRLYRTSAILSLVCAYLL